MLFLSVQPQTDLFIHEKREAAMPHTQLGGN